MKKFKDYKFEYKLPFDDFQTTMYYVMNEINFTAAFERFTIENPDCGISFEHPDMVITLMLSYLKDEDFPDLSHVQIENLKDFIHDVMCSATFKEAKKLDKIPSYNDIKRSVTEGVETAWHNYFIL